MFHDVFESGPDGTEANAPTGLPTAVPPASESELADVWHAREMAEQLAGALEGGYYRAQEAGRGELSEVDRMWVAKHTQMLSVLLARVLA